MAAEAKEGKEVIKRGIWSRRDFFSRLGWIALSFFGLSGLLGFIRPPFLEFYLSRRKGLKRAIPEILLLVRSVRSSNRIIAFGS